MTTQAEQLIKAIRRSRNGLTYGDLQSLRISTSPHKRLAEAGDLYLKDGERLARVPGRDGLIRFVIVRVREPLGIV